MIAVTTMNVKMDSRTNNMNNSVGSNEMVVKPPKSVNNIMVSVNTKTTAMEASLSSVDGQLSSSTVTTTSSSQLSASGRPNEPTHREEGDDNSGGGGGANKEVMLEDNQEDNDPLGALMDSLCDDFERDDG